jgi:hypothetical protein
MPARRGQGLTEYVIVAAVVAIAAIGIATLYGGSVRTLLGLGTTVQAAPAEPEVKAPRVPDAGAPDAN